MNLLYWIIFNLCKLISSKSRTLETVWYRKEADVFTPEVIRIEKHSFFGIFGMSRINNKTLDEILYIPRVVSYSEVVDAYNLHTFKTMMVYLKEHGKVRQINMGSRNILQFHMLQHTYEYNYSRRLITTDKIILHDNKEATLKMRLLYGFKNDKVYILGFPSDVISMVDIDSEMFKKAIDVYIKHFNTFTYKLITDRDR